MTTSLSLPITSLVASISMTTYPSLPIISSANHLFSRIIYHLLSSIPTVTFRLHDDLPSLPRPPPSPWCCSGTRLCCPGRTWCSASECRSGLPGPSAGQGPSGAHTNQHKRRSYLGIDLLVQLELLLLIYCFIQPFQAVVSCLVPLLTGE